MAIRPKNTTDIKVDNIDEKTASAGVDINGVMRFTTALFKPLLSTIELGTSTTSEHLQALWTKIVKSATTLAVKTTGSSDLTLGTNDTTRLTLTSGGILKKRLSHTGYTSGGEIVELTAAVNSTSTTPVTLYDYAVGADDTQVMIRAQILSRDNTSGAQSFLEVAAYGSRSGGSASAGGLTVLHTVGTALHTATLTASGTSLLLKVQNVSGSNTTSALATIEIIPLSTST